jgi:hypothetical protein
MIRFYFFCFILSFFPFYAYSQADCEGEIATHCEGGTLPLTECMKTKMKNFSKGCRKNLMERLSQEAGTQDPCAREFQEICGPDESIEECLKTRGNQLTSVCRSQFGIDGRPTLFDNPLVKKIIDSCMGDIKKMCPFDSKIIGKNPVKAIGDFKNCVVQSLSKVGKKCKDIFKPAKKKDDIQTLE